MRKYIKPTILIFVIIFVFGQVYYWFFSPYGKINTYFRIENFENHKNNYEFICDEVIKMSTKNKLILDPERYYFINKISTGKNQACFSCDEYSNFPPKKYPNWELSYELLKNYQKINESFPPEHGYEFDFICYRKNRISFHSENGCYAVVYSVDDKKPTFWFAPFEEDAIKVKKITKNWYHMWR